MVHHLGPSNERLEVLTPDLARVLACWTVLIAVRGVEVLNGRERGLWNCLLLGRNSGFRAVGSRRQRALEVILWRFMFTKIVLENLEALGQKKDIIDICMKFYGVLGFIWDGFLFWLAQISILISATSIRYLPCLTTNIGLSHKHICEHSI